MTKFFDWNWNGGWNGNNRPDAKNDQVMTTEDQAITVDALANDTDKDGDTLEISKIEQPSHGVATIVDNKIVFDPAGDFDDLKEGETKTVWIRYKIDDGKGGTDWATVDVTVKGVKENTPPKAKPDPVKIWEGESITVDALKNDSDADGDALTIVSIEQPGKGSAEIVGNKIVFHAGDDFDYLDEGQQKTVWIKYTVSDGNGGTAMSSVDVTVCGTKNNTPPTAKPDPVKIDEGESITVDALGNDSDPDGDALTIVSIMQPDKGSAEIVDNKIVFHAGNDFDFLEPGQSKTVWIKYTVDDGNGGTANSTVDVTVCGVNDDPNAKPDPVKIWEGESITVDALANDSDPNGDDLTIVSIEQPTKGSAEIVDGKIVFHAGNDFDYLDEGQQKTVWIKYTISDGNGGTAMSSVDVTVCGVKNNTPPTAKPDPVKIDEGESITVDALGNDSDPDGDALTIVSIQQPGMGSAEIVDNKIVFHAGSDFDHLNDGESKTVWIKYTVSDGNGGTATSTVDVTVCGVTPNTPPKAKPDPVKIDEGESITVDAIANDFDADGDALTIVSIQQPGMGSAEIVDNKIVFHAGTDFDHLTAGESKTVWIKYTVSDGNGGTATSTVDVTVCGVNEGPDAKPDPVKIWEGESITVDALANDSDADGDVLEIVSIMQPSLGSAEIVDGKIVFHAGNDFDYLEEGQQKTVWIKYTISDGNGGTATSTVDVTVCGVTPNTPPVAKPDPVKIWEGESITVDALANDSDADGDALEIISIMQPGMGSAEIVDNKIVFHAGSDFDYLKDGESKTVWIKYTVSDGNGGTATSTVDVTVCGVTPNTPPVAKPDPVKIWEGESITVDALANDHDADGDDLEIISIEQPGMGSAEIVDGKIVFHAGNEFDYLNDGESKTVWIKYTISDGNGGTAMSSVDVTVCGKGQPNLPPEAGDDKFYTWQDETANNWVGGNDSDPEGLGLTYELVDGPDTGDLTFTQTGNFSYDPPAGFHGEVEFTYRVIDSEGQTDTATVTVCVEKMNSKPVANDDKYDAWPNETFWGDVSENDFDVDGDALHFELKFGPYNGTINFNDDGSFDYKANAGFYGEDNFTYRVTDGNGGEAWANARICIEKPNSPPEAQDDKFDTWMDETVWNSVAGNDYDVDGDALSFSLVDGPDNGTLVFKADGSFDYTPKPGFCGIDSFTYKVSDGNGGHDTAVATICVNKPLTAEDDCYNLWEDDYFSANVRDNDFDGKLAGAVFELLSQPAHGSVTMDQHGQFNFTPEPGFSGELTFEYKVTGQDGTVDTATVTLKVGAVNDQPYAGNDQFTAQGTTPISGDVTGNDGDPDGDGLVYSLSQQPSHGTVQLNADGTFTYTADGSGFIGEDIWGYIATDNNGEQANAQVKMLLTAGNGHDSGNGGGVLTGGNVIQGSSKDDVLEGTNDIDLLMGNDGNDDLRGFGGEDLLDGGNGNDILRGNGAADRLFGQAGEDRLIGGAGDDMLNGGTGDDRLNGGNGADEFVFNAGDDADTIVDFDGLEGDMLTILGTGLSAEDIVALADDSTGDVIIDLGAGDSIKLLGLELDDLNADYINIG